ncbi:MAG TPA: hypothetical protein VNK50_13040 [Calidithermus sp.]|nr:hypothetical protein [Calidithermus sp.]
MMRGEAPEVVLFGPRGEGKTTAALMAMLAHAQAHARAGYPLPVTWLGAAGTLQAHRQKTHDSLREPLWQGLWRLRDGGTRAQAWVQGQLLVDLRLLGVGDEHGLDRARTQAHCAWVEEPAPAGEIGSLGVRQAHWEMLASSLRLPTHARVMVATSNYPDEDHWTWRRWVDPGRPDVRVFRIPAGERAPEEERRRWAEAITDPIMRRRLIEGRPGTILPGRPVAEGFNEDLHVARHRLTPRPGGELWLGQDGGLTPATVIGQRAGARIEILAALWSEHAGLRQHIRDQVRPWLGEHAPWVLDRPELLHVCYDPTIDTDSPGDSDVNPLRVMRHLLPGRYRAGVNVPWAWRRDPLLAALAALDGGQPLVVLDREGCRTLIRAWRGLWHYAVRVSDGGVRREEPHKPDPPWADLGDASAYLIAAMAPLPARQATEAPRVYQARRDFNPLRYHRQPPRLIPVRRAALW